MSLHYNAFISYKHAELDNKVAAAIERDLEHYHIPGKIRKKTGVKKIERIFRDKDELPITSDLSGTIEEALRNSDYLIVLCSTNTCKSMWVEREIKLFLQNHSQDEILTVIADGEPADVIPKILQTREITRINERGKEETFVEPVEPLCCDYRLKRHEVKSDEVPRLAATLIGCSYNELMNRQRQYKMRRLTAISAIIMAVLCAFGGYMLYSNKKINENYMQSLVNQSRYLSNESEKLLKNEQRIPALQLALAALPDEENQKRPVIPEAVKAITKASLAYVPQTGSNITSVWNYTMPDIIRKYVFSKDGSFFAAMDSSFNVRVWECATRKQVYEYSSVDDPASSICFVNEDTLIIRGSNFVKAVDAKSGTDKWNLGYINDDFTVGEPVGLSDKTLLIPTYQSGMAKISIENGELIGLYGVPDSEGSDTSVNPKKFSLSPSEDKFVFCNDFGEEKEATLFVYDMKNKTSKMVNLIAEGYIQKEGFVDDIKWIDDNTICISAFENGTNDNFGFLNMDAISTSHKSVYCFNAEDLSLRWKNDFSYTTIEDDSGFAYMDGRNAISYFSGNIVNIWDKETGELKNSYNTNDIIVSMKVSKDTGEPTFLTRNGGMATPDFEEGSDSINIMYYFTDSLDEAILSKGAYVHRRDSDEIIYYGIDVHDDEFTEFTDSPTYKKILSSDSCMGGDTIAILHSDDNGVEISYFDAADKKYVKDVKIAGTDANTYDFSMAGIEGNKNYLFNVDNHVFKLIEVDIESGETKETVIEKEYSPYDPIAVIKEGKLVYYKNVDYSESMVVVYDIASGTSNSVPIENDTSWASMNIEYNSDLGYVFCGGSFDQMVNVESGELVEFIHSADWNGTAMVSIDTKEKKVVTTDNAYIEVFNLEGEALYKIPCSEVKTIGMAFYTPVEKDAVPMLFVAMGNGNLMRYNAETGDYIGKTEFSYNKIFDGATFTFDNEKNMLYLQMGSILDLIDLESNIELTYVENAIGYHEDTDTFAVYSYDTSYEMKVGYFRHYTVDELIQKAQKLLEGTEMSNDFKTSYGIG